MINKAGTKLVWDDHSKTAHAIYDHNGLYEYLFLEDARSFQAKVDLAKQYHLLGISVWQIGFEDPKIWNSL